MTTEQYIAERDYRLSMSIIHSILNSGLLNILKKVYEQQLYMFENKIHELLDRINQLEIQLNNNTSK